MFGMINEALRRMVVARRGSEAWRRILERAGLPDMEFVRLDAYPDAVTYGLVGAAEKELGVEASKLMHDFGVFWVEHARTAGYGELFRAARGYTEFVGQLDTMHARLQLSFRELRAPEFSCEAEADSTLRVTYRSSRQGLAPFVAGILEGLGPVFGVRAEVTSAGERTDRDGRAEVLFRVRLEDP